MYGSTHISQCSFCVRELLERAEHLLQRPRLVDAPQRVERHAAQRQLRDHAERAEPHARREPQLGVAVRRGLGHRPVGEHEPDRLHPGAEVAERRPGAVRAGAEARPRASGVDVALVLEREAARLELHAELVQIGCPPARARGRSPHPSRARSPCGRCRSMRPSVQAMSVNECPVPATRTERRRCGRGEHRSQLLLMDAVLDQMRSAACSPAQLHQRHGHQWRYSASLLRPLYCCRPAAQRRPRPCPGPAPVRLGVGRAVAQVPLGVERRRAAGAGGGHGLAVGVVHEVARGEHARQLGARGLALGEDVAVLVDLDLALDDLRVRAVADRDERAVDLELALLAASPCSSGPPCSSAPSPSPSNRSTTYGRHELDVLGLASRGRA